jgi:agmatinase
LNIVGADIAEVSPPFDSLGGDTAFAVATLAYEIITSWVKSGIRDADPWGRTMSQQGGDYRSVGVDEL